MLVVAGVITPAQADPFDYWPEYGSFAFQNSWSYRNVNADKVNALGVTGSGIRVAVFDDGQALTDPTMRSKVIAYKDFIPGTEPDNEHGAMVASTVASDFRPENGVGGIAPGVSLLIARVCFNNGCDVVAARKAIAWAIEQGADVITESFTGYEDPMMHSAYAAAILRGVVVVTSMGNGGCQPYFFGSVNPGCVQGKLREYTQGAYPIAGLIAVGASDRNDAMVNTMGWGSSYGPNNDIIAPGYETSAYDNLGATNGFGGTSAAAPIVAGVAALILSVKPDLTPAQVQAIIQSTARKPVEIRNKVWDSCTKDESNNWHCNNVVDSTFPQQYFTGAGVVDAEAAVKLTMDWASGKLISEPTLTQADQVLTISWDGGPADIYLNSKLIASQVNSGYTYQGYLKQSVAVQIKQNGKLSKPNLAMITGPATILQPQVSSSNFTTYANADNLGEGRYIELRISEPTPEDNVFTWSYWFTPEEKNYSGIFKFSDGEIIPCKAQRWKYGDRPTWMYCELQRDRTSYEGDLYFIGQDSKLGPASNLIVGTIPNLPLSMSLRADYSDSGAPTISWSAVAGALSYKYSYSSQVWTEVCTTDLSVSPIDTVEWGANFYVYAYENSDCTGLVKGKSETLRVTNKPAKPAKPTGITVTSIGRQMITFDVPNRNPNSIWRIYRSDGLMLRIFQGQNFYVYLQPNEDVNGKTFTYRFAEGNKKWWATTWSELSEPITVAYAPVEPLVVECFNHIRTNEVRCDSNAVNGTTGTRIEYLDSDYQVIKAVQYENTVPRPRNRAAETVAGAVYVRVAGVLGEENNRGGPPYRRGEDRIYPISMRVKQGSIAVAR
ncbi:MAG: hypothetical protein RIQ88_184 [Actinomycetota bacterium]